MTPLEARIQACTQLWAKATDPESCLSLWFELQGLRYVAGQVAPMDRTQMNEAMTKAYDRGVRDWETMRRLEEGAVLQEEATLP